MSEGLISIGRWILQKGFEQGGKSALKTVGGSSALVVYSAVKMTVDGLVALEEGRDKECLETLRELYNLGGEGSPIALIDGKGQWISKERLTEFVTLKGGTAWNQEVTLSGYLGRPVLNGYWHPKKAFAVKSFAGAALGHVVRGDRNFGD